MKLAVLSKAKPVSYHAYPLNGVQDADILFECAFPEWDLVTFRLPDDDKRRRARPRSRGALRPRRPPDA